MLQFSQPPLIIRTQAETEIQIILWEQKEDKPAPTYIIVCVCVCVRACMRAFVHVCSFMNIFYTSDRFDLYYILRHSKKIEIGHFLLQC